MDGTHPSGWGEDFKVSIFKSHPTLLDPLGAWASSPPSVWAESETLPTQAPSNQTAPV